MNNNNSTTLDMSLYSEGLHYYINNPDFHILLPKVEEEINRYLHDRPIVVLTNGKANISFRRPGIENDIQAAFVARMKVVDVPLEPVLKKSIINLDQPYACSKHPEDLAHLFQICEQAGLLKELFFEILDHDTDYFQQIPKSAEIHLSPLGLYECGCTNYKNNRIFSDSRYFFERQVIEHIQKLVPDKNASLSILSLASGKLLQDWKLIGLLIKEGYKNFQWTLVDPINAKDAPIESLRNFLSKIPDVNVVISAYVNIADTPKELKDSLHAIVAADAHNVYGELIYCLSLLTPKGKIFYSGNNDFIELSSLGASVIRQPPACDFACKDIITLLPSGCSEISLAVMKQFAMSIYIIAALSRHGIRTIRMVYDLDKQHAQIQTKEIYTKLFPSITFEIVETTTQEIEHRIKEKEHFDFLICPTLDAEAEKRIGKDQYESVATHSFTRTTTAYFVATNSIKILRLNLKSHQTLH